MKKTLIAVLVLAAAAACNKAEVVEQNPTNAIAFENVFVDNAVKSVVDPSYTNEKIFSDFAVFGFVEGAPLFNNVTVSKNITNEDLTKSDWKYEGTQYWIAGAKYNFSAIAPKTNGNWSDVQATKDGVSFTFENNGELDVLYAQTPQIEGKASGNAFVEFTFRHILSKVKFSFENGYNASNATIRVKDINITNAHAAGKVALNANTAWTAQERTLALAFGNAATTAANADEAYAFGTTVESYNERLLIPGAVTNGYNVTFTVDLLVSGQVVKTYAHTATVNFTPEAGKSYDIKAVIDAENIDPENKQEPIEFTVAALPGWGTTEDVNATVNNKNN